MLTCIRQTSKIQTQRLDHQQLTDNEQSQQLVTANQGININQQILSTHTNLLLSLESLDKDAPTQERIQELRDLMLQVLKTNLQIYELVLTLHTNLPRQVERERPVELLDACGRYCPVHLEFITSAEAFLAVLKVRFKDAGLQKIERGQFALENSQTKRLIDLRQPWSTCMMPGSKVDMSMIFSQTGVSRSACPSCHHENKDSNTGDVEW